MLSWLLSCVTGAFNEDEQRGMMESLRNASKNTMFDQWLSATCVAPTSGPQSPPHSPAPAAEGVACQLGDIAAYLQTPAPAPTTSSQAASAAAGTFRPGWEVSAPAPGLTAQFCLMSLLAAIAWPH